MNLTYVRKKATIQKPKGSSSAVDEGYEIYETNEERSLRRTRKAIKDYALCNDFDIFATFTIADDRFNDERSRKRLATWLKDLLTTFEL